MRLKRVRIYGFKTFADKTEFELDGDLVAIVGPNGCGKSNIVDAILWGLGEPNARSLRAQTAQDVIFNGSEKRKPLGFAEVTLIFDNEDGTLPIDAAEVSVTRRLTRGGDSHFSINRKTCRLKDINDLLADSGLGRAGYAIVGQREIDQALSASAEERRAWIDEAAGVQRFRVKRIESIRRLDAAKEHLARLDQILADIEYQREPLREEAEAAQRFQTLKASLVEIESGLMMREVAMAIQEAERIVEQIASCERLNREDLDEVRRLADEAEALGEALEELERKMDAMREVRQGHLSSAERASAQMQMAQQRLVSLDELEQNLAYEQEHGDQRIQEAQSDLDVAAGEVERLEALLAQVSQGSEASKEQLAEFRSKLDALDAEIQRLRAAHRAYDEAIADSKRAGERLQHLDEELGGIERTLPDVQRGVSEAEEQVEAARGEKAQRIEKLAALKQELDALKHGDANLHDTHRRLLAEHSSLDAKRRGMESTIEAHEGLSQGASAVMQLVKRQQLPDVFVPVAEAIQVQPDLATALETALGASANDLIVPDESYAKAAIELLKRERLGRATFQPITMMRPSPNDGQAWHRERGVIGMASDQVECDPQYRPVIQSLLGRVLLVETIDDALRLKSTRGWNRIVTRDGEVVHQSGSVSGGRSSRQASGIIHRKAELGVIEQNLGGIRQRIQEAERAIAESEGSRQELEAKIKELDLEATASQQTLQEHEKWLQNLRLEFQNTEKERQRLEREASQLREVVTRAVEAPMPLEPLLQHRDEVLTELAKLSADAEGARTRFLEAEHALRDAKQRYRAAQERLQQAEQARDSRGKRLSGLGQERENARARIAECETERVQATQSADLAAKDLEVLAEEKRETLERSLRLAEQRREREEALRGTTDRIHKLEVERARADSRRSNAVERLLEEYAITEEEAAERGLLVELPEDAPVIVGRLRREMKALGEVNLGAIEAFARLTQRFEELDAQRNDVQAGIEELRTAVRELDRMTRDRFLQTFEAVRTEFRMAFAELFGGGEADLQLTDPDEVLTTGVHVDVTIPGKKRQRLELLSGGERSLSALAFLVALLRVKPSPLVVLDEVDAPLDGRNVDRFVAALKSFHGVTQFLVITHNMVTIESASVWFGVTMQEPGCTLVLPCKVQVTEQLVGVG